MDNYILLVKVSLGIHHSKIILMMCSCVCLCEYVHMSACACEVRGFRSPGASITESCELLHKWAENPTWVVWKSSSTLNH